MNSGSVNFDLADQRAEEEREAQIAAASRALRSQGTIYCQDCPAEIPADRRAACPSARRCIKCQGLYERQMKGR
ncbi:TraR/DksA family transcriptional regulator (plasmid) [Rhizobium lusitanum]|uniref:TraR/DksA C4-type zinc finger protein n=1 Tax=Rhizobium lusitanum TaxID=293958 RepID=UPI001618230A|nr:TraR/DksA C4-type zinc finger protein [Rhizobium lusitanum]QND45215.1 TraR/DksA family transcriptional regulator [Rhizobium lusitanum]